MDIKKKRILGTSIFIFIVALMILITVLLTKPLLELSSHPEELKEAVQNTGVKGILGFIAIAILQVFAAIVPGGPLEIAAGYAFGIVKGTLICDLAMSAGSVMVFLLSRKFGLPFIELFFSREKIEEVKILKTNERSRFIIFLLFLIPGTPKDILSYLVGLTDLELPVWIFIVAVGRFPSILLSAMSGTALSAERYEIFAVVILVICTLSLLGAWWYRKKNR
ncbi:MAG: TVP38/TMEM64 family protein [Eubacterium sp.]|nr:TVP38/TMEM64 family protein [Eubacterium sp.]